MLPRPSAEKSIRSALRQSPIVALVGPRQCGKTTLAKAIARPVRSEYFDLEDPVDRARLSSPQLTLGGATGLVVIDEVQRLPSLFEILRVLADRPRKKARFLILGSASPGLISGISESLAGRVSLVELGGFDLTEIRSDDHERLWVRGGFPRAYLARSQSESLRWRNDFIRTFLERDIPQLGIRIPEPALRRFWTMVAHFHGQVFNAAEFARSLGASEPTARRYLDILTGAYMVRQLQPWFENIKKRQVKSPKVYVRDSGVLHALFGLPTRNDLLGHPKSGASWEGFVIEQILALTGGGDAYFWATHGGAELDLLLMHRGRRWGFEVKRSDAPRLTKSMMTALEDLSLARLIVVYPGERSYRLHPKVDVIPISSLPGVLKAR